MKNYGAIVFLFFFNFICILSIHSQEEKSFYNWFDEVLGQDHTALYNGKQYFDKEKSVLFDDKHVYFKSNQFLKGTVKYDHQKYFDVELQYNLEHDDLILSTGKAKNKAVFKLIKDKVDEFMIDGHHFLRLSSDSSSKTSITGFVEVLKEDNGLFLVKKHSKMRRKKVKELTKERHLFYYFNYSYQFGILKNDKHHDANSKSKVVKLFPELKKQISTYYYENWWMKKSNPDAFMIGLFENIIIPSTH